jgi:hypothetical protein
MLDAVASKIDDFLWKGTCVSSTLVNLPIWCKQSLSPPLNPSVAESIPFQN